MHKVNNQLRIYYLARGKITCGNELPPTRGNSLPQHFPPADLESCLAKMLSPAEACILLITYNDYNYHANTT